MSDDAVDQPEPQPVFSHLNDKDSKVRPRFTKEEKTNFFLRLRENGGAGHFKTTCTEMGISEGTARKWKNPLVPTPPSEKNIISAIDLGIQMLVDSLPGKIKRANPEQAARMLPQLLKLRNALLPKLTPGEEQPDEDKPRSLEEILRAIDKAKDSGEELAN